MSSQKGEQIRYQTVALQNKDLLCQTSNIAQIDFDIDFNIDQYFDIDFNMTQKLLWWIV